LSRQYSEAVNLLNKHRKEYGSGNELLYFYDLGMVLHLSGEYTESAAVFERSKRRYDELYTQSLTKLAGSWLVNDYTLPYQGEDFERVLVNVFQAMNYARAGQINEALVEARDVNAVLNAINLRYPEKQKNVYRNDAFAQFLSGIFFEVSGGKQEINDAFIFYKKALAIYEGDYRENYGFAAAPRLLKENLLRTAKVIGAREFDEYRREFSGAAAVSAGAKNPAQIYVLIYHGFAPQKIQDKFLAPIPDGHLLKIAFPKYERRFYEPLAGDFCAQNSASRVCAAPEIAEDIESIAIKDLASRKIRIMAKAALRPLAKYGLTKLRNINWKMSPRPRVRLCDMPGLFMVWRRNKRTCVPGRRCRRRYG